jgi:hypothetical protein
LNIIGAIFNVFISNPYAFTVVVDNETKDFSVWLKNQPSWEEAFTSSPLFSPSSPVKFSLHLPRASMKLWLEVLIDPLLKILCSMVEMKDVSSFLDSCNNWKTFFDKLNDIVEIFDSHVELKRMEPLGSGGNGEVVKYRIDGIVNEVNVAVKFFFSRSEDFRSEISSYDLLKTSNNKDVSNNNNIFSLKMLSSDSKRRILLFEPIGKKVRFRDLDTKMVIDFVKNLRYIHENFKLVHRDIRMGNLLIIGEGKDKKLILIDWGKRVGIGENKGVAGSVGYGSRSVLGSYGSGECHTYAASDDLGSFVRVLLSLKIPDIEADLTSLININSDYYADKIKEVWDFYSDHFIGLKEALKAGDDGDYDQIIQLIEENYFFTKRL